MYEPITGTYETKQIHELNAVGNGKLTGKELLLIDLNNGNETMNVTVDTLLGYIRDQINNSTGTPTPPTGGGTSIHLIPEDEDVPIDTRDKGHYYIKIVDSKEAQISTGLPRVIKVSPNMSLRRTIED